MSIPFLELLPTYHELKQEIDDAIASVMSSGWYIQGHHLEKFEDDFSTYIGSNHCIGTGNGLDALTILLKAVGIGPGDEVIVPSMTFIATWLSVTALGATVVPVDVEYETANLDPSRIEEAITERTKAIVAVHLHGRPAPMKAICGVARKHQLFVFEDAAQAHGALYGGIKAGNLADGAAFSFYPGKNLGAFGDGGAITVNDTELAKKCRMIGNYGSETKYHHEFKGCNSDWMRSKQQFYR